jgi:pyruvate dehydrogenase E2 component (dihydrolipoamide acetyltransferase)
MITEIILPALGETLNEATIVAWHKKVGERVAKGEALFEVQTDKANFVVESPASGYVQQILFAEGATVPVTKVIAYLADTLTEPVIRGEEPVVGGAREIRELEVKAPPAPSRKFASPRARRLAREQRIDLSLVTGTGHDGRITEADVERFLAERAAKPAPVPTPSAAEAEQMPLSRMRQVIAQRMAESKRTAPHFYISMDIDMTEAVRVREGLRKLAEEQEALSFSYNDLIVKAIAGALREYPQLNASFGGDGLVLHRDIHVGVAVALDEGLIVPVVRNADKKSVFEIAAEVRALSAKAREKRLLPDEYSGSTLTVSNLGMFGVDQFVAIINPPEAAILAVGQIKPTPVVRDGQVVVAQVMTMTLSADHRVVDGATAARFLGEVKRRLENLA